MPFHTLKDITELNFLTLVYQTDMKVQSYCQKLNRICEIGHLRMLEEEQHAKYCTKLLTISTHLTSKSTYLFDCPKLENWFYKQSREHGTAGKTRKWLYKYEQPPITSPNSLIHLQYGSDTKESLSHAGADPTCGMEIQ